MLLSDFFFPSFLLYLLLPPLFFMRASTAGHRRLLVCPFIFFLSPTFTSLPPTHPTLRLLECPRPFFPYVFVCMYASYLSLLLPPSFVMLFKFVRSFLVVLPAYGPADYLLITTSLFSALLSLHVHPSLSRPFFLSGPHPSSYLLAASLLLLPSPPPSPWQQKETNNVHSQSVSESVKSAATQSSIPVCLVVVSSFARFPFISLSFP
mmetsp:Transcript_40926/g.80689  ORF Transcript_40926/g.80689 Transcript_40926/m.80689 type:complete len:207 (-) Transcript_40926:347-967(-)